MLRFDSLQKNQHIGILQVLLQSEIEVDCIIGIAVGVLDDLTEIADQILLRVLHRERVQFNRVISWLQFLSCEQRKMLVTINLETN